MIALEILLYSLLILLFLSGLAAAFVFLAKLMVEAQQEGDTL